MYKGKGRSRDINEKTIESIGREINEEKQNGSINTSAFRKILDLDIKLILNVIYEEIGMKYEII